MPAWRLGAFAVGAALIIALILHVGYIAGNSSMPAERWTYDLMRLQDRKLEETRKYNRIITVAGSNSLFGFDGDLIEGQTGYRFVNYGTHAGYSVLYYADRLRGKLHPGDIVVIPLELHNYKVENRFKSFQQTQVIAWIQRRYNQFPLSNMAENWYAPLEMILSSLANTAVSPPDSYDFKRVDNQPNASCGHYSIPPTERYYNAGEANAYCNVYAPSRPDRQVEAFYAEGGQYPYPFNIDAETLNEDVLVLSEAVTSQGAKALFTWPSLLMSKLSPADQAAARSRLEQSRDRLKELGIDLFCDIDDAYFRKEFFINTQYHLNAWGATLRSKRLIDCLVREGELRAKGNLSQAERTVNAVNMNFDLHEAISYRASLGHELLMFERTYLDFNRIALALERYRKDFGSYPRAARWSIDVPQESATRNEWIEGLVPKYIEALPSDPRRTSDQVKQYRYLSNGTDFKLIAHGVDDCNVVAGVAPQLVDPQRRRPGGCYAYGFWSSQRAAQW